MRKNKEGEKEKSEWEPKPSERAFRERVKKGTGHA